MFWYIVVALCLNYPISFFEVQFFFLNFGYPQNAPESQKNNLGTFCWTPLSMDFLHISWLPENNCLATRIMRNACFGFSRPTLFVDLMLILYEKDRFGHPFTIQWAPKWDPKSTKWRKNVFQIYVRRSPYSRRVTRLTVRSPNGLDLRFCIYFTLLCISQHREMPRGLTLRNPVAAQMGTKIDQVAPMLIKF